MARMSVAEIERYLWSAANILRGAVSAADYQDYVYPLIFYKWLSDRHDEARAAALAASGGDTSYADAREHYEWVLPSARSWSELRSVPADIGEWLTEAFGEIERENPRLAGVFSSGARWTNKEKVSDRTLAALVEHLSTRTLDSTSIGEDELGNGYEYLIREFASDGGHNAQEFYTNRTVVHLMTELLQIKEGERVYDPTCGTAGMLINAAARLRERGQDAAKLKLYGQEIKAESASIARTNLYLHGIREFEIRVGDTLLNPRFLSGDRLETFDVVLANPPYSMDLDQAFWAQDPWGRNGFGTPPPGNADYAFFEHILASMDPATGRSATLWPHGILFRTPEIRKAILEADLIEAVIGLGPDLFYNSPMESCVVICRSKKVPERQGKVLLIDASKDYVKRGKQSELTEEHQRKIADAYLSFADQEGFAKVVPLDEIRERDHSLNIPEYIRRSVTGVLPTDEAINQWSGSVKSLREHASAVRGRHS
jgi:type I restriction enzyme M protein